MWRYGTYFAGIFELARMVGTHVIFVLIWVQAVHNTLNGAVWMSVFFSISCSAFFVFNLEGGTWFQIITRYSASLEFQMNS